MEIYKHYYEGYGEQIELEKRDWEMVGRMFLACTQLYRSNPTDSDYIQNRLGPGLTNLLNEAYPEFDGRLKLTIVDRGSK